MLRAAVLQMVSTDKVDENLRSAESLIEQAAADAARFLALPEFFPLISVDERAKLSISEKFGDGPIQEFLGTAARRHGVWLLGGTIPLVSGDPDHVFNSSLLFNDQGKCVARYDKIHLFDVYVDMESKEGYNESATMKAGDEVVTTPTDFGDVAMSVCYDLRFPELYRRMAGDKVVMITVPSAFTERTGRQHWEMLLRARAVENLCYVVAPGQGGRHNEKRTTWGHSMIVSPWGEVLCCVESGPGYACADLDFEHLQALRGSFPALKHRKLAI